MNEAFHYAVMPDPDGYGWMVTAKGYVARSLPYGTEGEAIQIAEELVRRYPGSTVVVIDHPPALTPLEVEHRLSP